uniref:Uncharacterized protein TCIL3000_11_12910 n=1 Tax=Trypanosoma congolense (strain IL3000) TaxID=1068625 RepID=G0V2C1_TRYCI|nr:unnamed protein product [Trypanosoma congolense IL3000]
MMLRTGSSMTQPLSQCEFQLLDIEEEMSAALHNGTVNRASATVEPHGSSPVCSARESSLNGSVPASWVIVSESRRYERQSQLPSQWNSSSDEESLHPKEGPQHANEELASNPSYQMTDRASSSLFWPCTNDSPCSTLEEQVRVHEKYGATPDVSACHGPVVSAPPDEDDASHISTAGVDELRLLNSHLQAQLVESNKRSARHLLEKETAVRELEETRKTLSLLKKRSVHHDRCSCEACLERKEDFSSSHEQQPAAGGASSLFGSINRVSQRFLMGIWSPTAVQRRPRAQYQHPNHRAAHYLYRQWERDNGVTEGSLSYAVSDHGQQHLNAAKGYAQQNRGEEALASLLLALTSDSFDTWGSLLDESGRWNVLSSPYRRQWDCVIADKIYECLCSEEASTLSDAKVPNGRTTQFHSKPRPDLIAKFVLDVMARHMEKSNADELQTVSHAVRTGTPPAPECVAGDASEGRVKVPPTYRSPLTTLRGILLKAAAAHPTNTSLLYALTSIEAVEGREEAAIRLFQDMIRHDPKCLLRRGTCGVT